MTTSRVCGTGHCGQKLATRRRPSDPATVRESAAASDGRTGATQRAVRRRGLDLDWVVLPQANQG